MNYYWQKYAEKIDSLSLRERGWIFLAISVTLVVIANSLLIEPLLQRQKILSQQVNQQQGEIRSLHAQTQVIVQSKSGTSSADQKRLQQLQQQLAEINLMLQDKQRQLVEPDKIAVLLEEMLNKNRQLQLLELKTLPVSTLAEATKSDKAQAPSDVEKQIFRHGVEITVKGNYQNLLNYLNALEKLPVKMFWGKVELAVVDYPSSTLKLTLYTLSLDKTWLIV